MNEKLLQKRSKRKGIKKLIIGNVNIARNIINLIKKENKLKEIDTYNNYNNSCRLN